MLTRISVAFVESAMYDVMAVIMLCEFNMTMGASRVIKMRTVVASLVDIHLEKNWKDSEIYFGTQKCCTKPRPV
jgi:hypothetical protein